MVLLGVLLIFATCGGIFRESIREFIGDLSTFLDVRTVLVVEFYGVLHVIEQAQKMGLTSLWFKCDFTLVCATFTVQTNVPWMFCNRWNTCLNYYRKIRFKVPHIFREANVCVDKLVNLGFIHREYFHWYNRLLSNIFLKFFY